MGSPTSLVWRLVNLAWAVISFVYPLSINEIYFLVTTSLRRIFQRRQPVDDRLNARDRLLLILAKVPQDNVVTAALFGQFISALWETVPKPFLVTAPPNTQISPSQGEWKEYRHPDGRYNSIKYPTVGMGWTRYNSPNWGTGIQRQQPDPAVIFAEIFQRKQFIPHANKVNTFMFDLAILITHDLFWTSSDDITINTSSSYADMQPLYGRNKEEQDKIRTFSEGQIRKDYFANTRISFQLPGVGALLVLFSRNHNFIAQKLLQLNENGRFSKRERKPEELDEDLFQTARLINCGCYVNLIIHDYLRAIIGVPHNSPFLLHPDQVPPAQDPQYGNQSSLEFNFVYRWHSSIGEADEKLLPRLTEMMRTERGKHKIEDGLPLLDSDAKNWLVRGKDGAFDSNVLADQIRAAMNQIAGKPGAFNVPAALLQAEALAITQGRKPELRIPTLNEYRKALNYKVYERFEDINNDIRVSSKLKELYKDVNAVELYPGLIAEQTREKSGGVGISDGTALGYSITAGILTDAVNLIRNDRYLSNEHFNAQKLTTFGYNLAMNPAMTGVNTHNGSVMAHLLSLLDGNFNPNESCVLDPYHVR